MPNIIKDAQRIDKALIIGSIKKTDDGYLQGNAVVARSGILEYFEGGKVVRELVTDEELARADSLISLKMKPVTNGHPSVKLVTSQNVKQFQCGFTGENVVCEDGRLVTPITINDNVAITDVEVNKRRQLSCGYICDEIEEPGVWNGQPYDRKQTNRRYNHVALCDHARAGSVASLHLDASDVYECGEVDFKGDGGPGSGNFGHSGRPGEQGGSGEGGGGNKEKAKELSNKAFEASAAAHESPSIETFNNAAKAHEAASMVHLSPEIHHPAGLNHQVAAMNYKRAAENLKNEHLGKREQPAWWGKYPGLSSAEHESEQARISLGRNDSLQNTHSQRSRPMPVTIKIDGIDYPDQAPEVAKRLEKLDADLIAAKSATAAIQTKLDAMTAERDAGKVKLDAAQVEIAAAPAKIAAAAKARADLVAIAKPHLDKADAEKVDTLSDVQIKKAVAIKAFPTSKEKIDAVKEDAADAINVWFDAAIGTLKNDGVNAAARQNRQDAVGSDRVHVDGCQCDACMSNGKPNDINEEWKKNKEDSFAKKAK